jgi:hypothetical protein
MMSNPSLPDDRNRRATPRKMLRQPVTVAYGATTAVVRTWDLGRDGMCLLSPRPIAPGTRCKLGFELPLAGSTLDVAVAAKVVYSSYSAAGEFKIGTVFVDLDEDTALTLGKFAAG